MKQFATWFTHGVVGGANLRRSIYHAKTGAEVLERVDAFFTAQIANGAGSEVAQQEDGLAEFPEDLSVCSGG
jgi:hypothetical protein